MLKSLNDHEGGLKNHSEVTFLGANVYMTQNGSFNERETGVVVLSLQLSTPIITYVWEIEGKGDIHFSYQKDKAEERGVEEINEQHPHRGNWLARCWERSRPAIHASAQYGRYCRDPLPV
jgi:hypothetical protein